MQRQKTAEEFEQERRDEEFARQLQEQLDAEEQVQQQRRQQQQQSPPPQTSPRPSPSAGYPAATQSRGQLYRCPNCETVNGVDLRPNQQVQCGTCGSIFSPPPPIGGGSPSRGPIQHPQQHQQQRQYSSRITCQQCRSINEIPTNAATTKFMCGHCYRILTFNQTPQAIQQQQQQQYVTSAPLPPATVAPQQQQQQQAPQEEEGSGQVYQATVVKKIQVRCGECDTINQVRANPKDNVVKFVCSTCQEENEVELG